MTVVGQTPLKTDQGCYTLQFNLIQLINKNVIIVFLQKVMPASHFQFGFQCQGVFQVHCGVQEHMETDHYSILFVLSGILPSPAAA